MLAAPAAATPAPTGSDRRARTPRRAVRAPHRAVLPALGAAGGSGGGGERAGVGISGGISGGGSVETRLGGWGTGRRRAGRLEASGAPVLELRERVERAELGLGSAEGVVLRRP